MTGTSDMSRANTICYDATNQIYYTAGTFTDKLVLNQNIVQQTMQADFNYDAFIGRFVDNGGAIFSRTVNPNATQDDLSKEPNSNIVIYPNPATDNVTISSLNNEEITSVKITDLTGRIIFNKEIAIPSSEIKTDVSILSKGTYIINIVTNKSNYNLKFVIIK